ncbi:MAG: deoxyribose-phosphate aldolase [Rikenellaceae bacterium]|nr:deoxyribose-phosphate aldolase [Rikenellaceae bacterium]MCL2692943.1 deoxyribose-phosphate aldolase [Rikenellaceae bacterium]
MEYKSRLKEFGTCSAIDAIVREAEQRAADGSEQLYRQLMECLDVTWLGATWDESQISERTKQLIDRHAACGLPPVASVCVHPNFVETVGLAAGDTGLRITSVGGGFPDGQTFLEVKMLEVAMAVENGADEVDVVMTPGLILAGRYDEAASEIETLRSEIGEDVTLKVIIESGALGSPELIRNASLLSMMAGADFVKSSTGRDPSGGITPEAAAVICCAIRDYAAATDHCVGFKASGGIRTLQNAAMMCAIVESVLGREWLTPALFRIGASALYDGLLSHFRQ